MFGFFKSGSAKMQVGVDFLPTGVSMVGVSMTDQAMGQVRYSDFIPAVGGTEQAQALQQWVTRNGLKHTPCVSLIAKHDVQMFQLEKPAVEEAELLQAINWKIKDLISYDIQSAVVDLFEFPPSGKNASRQLNAVVANENVVASYVEAIRQSGLELQAIDIHELVSKNYGRVKDFSGKTTAILQFGDRDGMLTIYQDGDLYVSRDIKLGLLNLESVREDDDTVYDNLLLELQRSMDYFESFYALGLVQQMLVFPQIPETERMATYLQNYVAYDLDFVEVDVNTQGEEKHLDSHCFSAYCAALRSAQA